MNKIDYFFFIISIPSFIADTAYRKRKLLKRRVILATHFGLLLKRLIKR
jgi:hypothetical protein